jgi:cell division protein FtsI (penicillin-binding protein 3)
MDGALRLMDVAPDDLDAWLAAQAAAEAKKAGAKPAAAPVAALDVVPESQGALQ